jgi:hypothetical protein
MLHTRRVLSRLASAHSSSTSNARLRSPAASVHTRATTYYLIRNRTTKLHHTAQLKNSGNDLRRSYHDQMVLIASTFSLIQLFCGLQSTISSRCTESSDTYNEVLGVDSTMRIGILFPLVTLLEPGVRIEDHFLTTNWISGYQSGVNDSKVGSYTSSRKDKMLNQLGQFQYAQLIIRESVHEWLMVRRISRTIAQFPLFHAQRPRSISLLVPAIHSQR